MKRNILLSVSGVVGALIGILFMYSIAVGKVQPPQGNIVLYGVVMEPARSKLASVWDDSNPNQNERAFCVCKYSVGRSTKDSAGNYEIVVRVWDIKNAVTRESNPGWIDFDCPVGWPTMHVHTPTSCYADGCHLGGLAAWDAEPSRIDLETLRSRGDGFAVIQFDRSGFRFYYPDDVRETVGMDSLLFHPLGYHAQGASNQSPRIGTRQ